MKVNIKTILLFGGLAAAAGSAQASFNFMNPGNWFGNNDRDRYYDRYDRGYYGGPYGWGGPYGGGWGGPYGGYGPYGGWGGGYPPAIVVNPGGNSNNVPPPPKMPE